MRFSERVGAVNLDISGGLSQARCTNTIVAGSGTLSGCLHGGHLPL